MFPINQLNPLNEAGLGAAAGLQTPLGWQGSALGRLNGGLLGAGGLGGLDMNNVEALQENMALSGALSWLGEEQALANQVNALNQAAQANNGASNGSVAPIGGGGAAPSVSAPSGGAPAGGAPAAGAGSSTTGTLQNPADASSQASGSTGEWGPQDEQFLGQDCQQNQCSSGPGAGAGSSGGSTDFQQLFSDFGQTSEGNCASVAVIKAAMDKYGTKAFQSVTKSGNGYQVQQQDGKSVTVTSQDLQQAAQAAKLSGKPSAAKSQAVLMYAVIGKNSGGVDKLGNGADPKQIAQALGLGNKIKDVSPGEAGQAPKGAVAWNNEHAVYEDQGKVDHYGQAEQANGTDTRGGQLTQAFEFT